MSRLGDAALVLAIAAVALLAALRAPQDGRERIRPPWDPPAGRGLMATSCAVLAAVGLAGCAELPAIGDLVPRKAWSATVWTLHLAPVPATVRMPGERLAPP